MRRYLLSKTPAVIILLFVSLLFVGNFFNSQTAQAQVKKDRPDFQITRAAFDGRNLHVEYINATGVGYPRIRYEVGFQWYDTLGTPLGIRRWLTVPEVERGGVAIFDNKYKTELSYRGLDRRIYGEQLLYFINHRPDRAVELRVTVDDENRVSEMDETNNVASLRFSLPDLTITSANFSAPNRVEVKYKNIKPAVITDVFRIGFTWVNDEGATLVATRGLNVFEPTLGREGVVNSASADVSYDGSDGRQLGERLAWFLERRPLQATKLKITIDDAKTLTESDEQNNVVLIQPPSLLPPDLIIVDASLTLDALRFLVRNIGQGAVPPANPISLWFEWVDASDARVGKLAWVDMPVAMPSGTYLAFDGFRSQFVRERLPGFFEWILLADFLAGAPENAVNLKVHADGPNTIRESDEANNVVRLAIKRPDLIVGGEIQNGVESSVFVKNIGSADIKSPFKIVYEQLDASGNVIPQEPRGILTTTQDVIAANGSIQPLAPSNADLVALVENAAAEAVKLRVRVDAENVIKESKEDNNALTLTLPKSNLRVASAKLEPLPMLEVIVANDSQVYARQRSGRGVLSFWLDWVDADGKLIANAPRYWTDVHYRGGIEPKKTEQFRFLGEEKIFAPHGGGASLTLAELLKTAPSNATALRVLVDGPNDIPESNESDNTALIPKPETSKLPDLALTAVTRVGGVVKVTIVNGTNDTLRAPLLQFKWLDAKGVALGTSPISYWQHETIASGKTGDFTLEYEYWREDGVTRFLKDPPAGTAMLLATIDPENKLKESNEDNNSARVALGQPDLVPGNVEVRDGSLYVEVRNAGTADSVATSMWLMWFDKTGPLANTGVIDLPAIAAGATITVSIPPAGDAVAHRFVREPPPTATRLRVFLDGKFLVVEMNEKNNDIFISRDKFLQKVPTTSDLTFNGQPMVFSGSGFSVSVFIVSIKNDGKESTGSFVWQMRWLDDNGKQVGEMYRARHPGLDKGQTFGLPSDVTVDQYALGTPFHKFLQAIPSSAAILEVVLDPDNVLTELNEKNNQATVQRESFAIMGNQSPIADAGEDIVARDDDSDGIEIVRFYSRNSSDPDGKIVSWVWRINDKEVANGQYPYWRNAPVGTHTVTLEVKDDKGAYGMDKVIVKIEGSPTVPPDLIIDSIELTPAEPKPSDVVFFTVRVKNIGPVYAEGSWMNLNIDLDNNKSIDIQLGQPAVKKLAPSETQTWNWKDASNQYYHWQAKEGTHLIRSCVDIAGAIKESDERNNCLEKIITVGTPVIKPPELNLTLSVENISSASAAGAAAGSVATGGLFLALLTFLGGGLLIYAHNGTPGTVRDFFGVYPLVFASPEESYMRLQECGPEGCQGKHFAQHRALKYLTKGSLVAAVGAGALKLVIATALATLLPSSQAILAESKEVHPGDKLRATMVVKNVGQSKAGDIVLTLPCPAGTIWASTTLNSKADNRNADNGLSAADLEAGKSHQLAVVCQVKDSAATSQQKLKFVGTASAKGLEKVFQSNTVELQARPRPEPEKPVEPEVLSDLTVEGLGIVSDVVVGKANQPFKAVFTGIVRNTGAAASPSAQARLRVDIGANGTWDNLGASLISVPSLNPDQTAVAKWELTWNAPLGQYAFEVCADSDNQIQEASETNNCFKDKFTLQTGEEPMFEESEELF